MQSPNDPIRETYFLTAEEAAAALAATVVRAQLDSTKHGGLARAERAVVGAERWFVRLLVAGVPLALGLYLLVATSWHQAGGIAIAVGVVAYLLAGAFQRVEDRVERAVDDAVDPLIAKSGRGALQQAIESGQARILHGSLQAELIGEVLKVRAGGNTFALADVRAAWLAEAGQHLVLGDRSPDLRSDFSAYVVLPARGSLAAKIRALHPAAG